MSGVESVHIKQIVQSVLLRVNGESHSHIIIIYYSLPQTVPLKKRKLPDIETREGWWPLLTVETEANGMGTER